jgi:glycosyltransferase involved in cell wall biosynthesis
MTTPIVSVLMTSYNREDYIAESIESVLCQTYTDFELIVCDDASRDRTVEIAQCYARRDARIRVIVNDQNLGDYPNRNHAAGFVRGRYMKFHDSDDVMYPHCLELMVSALDAEPRADFALSAHRAWSGGPSPMLLTPSLAYEREFLGTGLFHLGPGAALFRSAFFHDRGGFAPSGAASDYLFWLRACARVNVLLVQTDLFYYRVHNGQELSSAVSSLDYARSKAQTWAMLNSDECPLAGARLEQAKRNFVFTIVRDAYYHVRHSRYREAVAVLREAAIGPSGWMHYLRRPSRTTTAGTPAPGS